MGNACLSSPLPYCQKYIITCTDFRFLPGATRASQLGQHCSQNYFARTHIIVSTDVWFLIEAICASLCFQLSLRCFQTILLTLLIMTLSCALGAVAALPD